MIIPVDNLHELCKIKDGKYDVNTIDEAYHFCKKTANKHYENFPVGSILVPRKKAKYFYSIYAFSRIADDIADELTITTDQNTANHFLTKYEDILRLLFEKKDVTRKDIEIKNPIFLALQDTIINNNIPITPLSRLVTAFR